MQRINLRVMNTKSHELKDQTANPSKDIPIQRIIINSNYKKKEEK